MRVDAAYDAINTAIFLPWGGSRRVRRVLVDELDVQPTHRVLELGCGTGQVTEILVERAADVVAVDALPSMLVGALRRAPGASFVVGDAIDADVGNAYDRVVLSFVLHNFDDHGRLRLLRRAAAAVREGGRIGVLDWALPRGRLRRQLWRKFLYWLEPSRAVQDVLDGGIENAAQAAELWVVDRREIVGGRAQVLVLAAPMWRREWDSNPR